MSVGDEGMAPLAVEIGRYLKDISSELSRRKSRRSKEFRLMKSTQMKDYHARKRALEDENKRLQAEIEALQQRCAKTESELKSIQEPRQGPPQQKRRNFGFGDMFEQPQCDDRVQPCYSRDRAFTLCG